MSDTGSIFAILALMVSILALVVALTSVGNRTTGSPDERLASLERRVDALAARPNGTAGAASDDMADVLDLVTGGQKIAAIKLYRARTGAGLAEAKEAVEDLEDRARP